jgi:hypothetical protein
MLAGIAIVASTIFALSPVDATNFKHRRWGGWSQRLVLSRGGR